jgi:hypothetical protein
MDDDRRTARIVGLSLTAICCMCFGLSAFGARSDQPASQKVTWQSEMSPVLFVTQTVPMARADQSPLVHMSEPNR